jgi:hypothetical protein
MKNSQTNKDNDSQSFGINQPFHSAIDAEFFLADVDPEGSIDNYNREEDDEQRAEWEQDEYNQMYLDSIARNLPLKEYKVMHSNAGYYIGSSYEENVGDAMHPIYVEFPFERVSGYYPTKELASQSLINYNI